MDYYKKDPTNQKYFKKYKYYKYKLKYFNLNYKIIY